MKSKKPTLEDQLAFISAQHEIYPTELFSGLVEAKEEGEKVEVRGIPAIFMNGRRVDNRDIKDLQSMVEEQLKKNK